MTGCTLCMIIKNLAVLTTNAMIRPNCLTCWKMFKQSTPCIQVTFTSRESIGNCPPQRKEPIRKSWTRLSFWIATGQNCVKTCKRGYFFPFTQVENSITSWEAWVESAVLLGLRVIKWLIAVPKSSFTPVFTRILVVSLKARIYTFLCKKRSSVTSSSSLVQKFLTRPPLCAVVQKCRICAPFRCRCRHLAADPQWNHLWPCPCTWPALCSSSSSSK